jgi:hypothetical protein
VSFTNYVGILEDDSQQNVTGVRLFGRSVLENGAGTKRQKESESSTCTVTQSLRIICHRSGVTFWVTID